MRAALALVGFGVALGIAGCASDVGNASAGSGSGVRVKAAADMRAAAATSRYSCAHKAKKYANGNVYLYATVGCKGDHGAKDNGNDSDYGDGKGRIEHFDNKAVSLFNGGKKPVKFYSYPKYNGKGKGDSFCVAPGHWVNKLWHYGDTKGTWSKSISSHRWVSGKTCTRWFG